MVFVNKKGPKLPAAYKYDPTLKPPEFYAEVARGGGIDGLTYKPPFPKEVGWPQRIRAACRLIRPYDDILEIGAGFGILPAIAWHGGHRGEYRGLDFCEEALQAAREGNIEFAHQHASFGILDFDCEEGRDAIRREIEGGGASSGPIVVSCETLEHLEHDVELVEAIPIGTFCIFTVPQFWARSHLRRFPRLDDARQRYGHLLNARYELVRFYRAPEAGWILIWGVREDARPSRNACGVE